MHEKHAQASQVGRLTVQSTNLKQPTLRCGQSTGRSTDRLGPVDWRHNGQKYDYCAGRPGGRHFCPFQLPTSLLFGAYIKWSFWAVFNKNFKSLFSHLYNCFCSKFLKNFCVKKIYLLFVFKGWKNQRKIVSLGIWFWSSFLSLSSIFLKYFSLWFVFQTPCFLTLELSSLSYLHDLVFVRIIVCGLLRSPRVVCGLLWSPRLYSFLCFGFVFIPLV